MPVTDDGDAGTEAARAALPLTGGLARFLSSRGHADEAEDLVQDIFVLLLSRGRAVDPGRPGPFRSFLYAVAYRLSANASRRRRRRRALPLAEAATQPAAEEDPERLALRREQVRRAAAAVDSLPPLMRAALLLVAGEGKSVREAAADLGVSEAVVRARVCRGRRRLAALLKEDR